MLYNCYICKQDLPRGRFYPRRDRPKGIMSRCKDCNREYSREGRAKWDRSPRGRYAAHKKSAKRRGIEFFLTFEQWWRIWQERYGERGRGSSDYCMARNGDTGPYAEGNVRIITVAENARESSRDT